MNEEHSIRAIPSALQQAGIEDRQFGGGFLQITETTGLAIARLRSFPEVQETSSREILLPEITGQAITGDPSVLCLRPGEWLFTSESMGGEQLHEHVRSRSNPAHGCV
jgi:sarcosine oxidase gamma subunit